ncbi:unknown [Feldmannia species virus]|uniref:Uncharacterized protein n=1 Tax=Feldmannia species virus TaxID=39420 RepID=B5LWG0_9PHYC|nr:hypothetical protein FeldSpV_gp071 [Feldmannia species virus]ACH46823.1 unknown [Feldmannia species virus]
MGLVGIVFLLPGKIARDFRRKSAAKICRILGGDLTLISEIEQHRNALQSTSEGRATQAFLLNTGSSENSRNMQECWRYSFIFLELSKQDLDCKKQALKRQRCKDMVDQYKILVDIGVKLDDRTKMNI